MFICLLCITFSQPVTAAHVCSVKCMHWEHTSEQWVLVFYRKVLWRKIESSRIGWSWRRHKRGGRTERVTDEWRRRRKRDKERADQSCVPRFLQLLIQSSGWLCVASGFIPSRSSPALVSFGEIPCPLWAVFMPARQPALPGHDGEREREREREREFSFLSCFLPHMSFVAPLFLLSLIVFLLLCFPPFLLSCPLSEIPYLEINVFFLPCFLNRRTFRPPRMSAQHTRKTLLTVRQFPAQRRCVCYKSFRCVRGWLKLGLLLCFAELLSSPFFFLTLAHLLFPVSFWCHTIQQAWKCEVFFSSFVLQKEQLGAANKRGPLISCLHITAEGESHVALEGWLKVTCAKWLLLRCPGFSRAECKAAFYLASTV